MSAHTLGPLEVGYYTTTDAFRAIHQHAAVMRPDGSLVAVTGSSTGKGAIESLGVAHLFAAAPEMYALLSDLALILEHGGDFELGSKGKHRDLVKQCKALLAKARGA